MGKRITPDGAFWAHMGIVAGMAGLPSVPPHRWGLDWQRCFRSLGVALGRHELRRLELHVAQQGWARSPIARRDSPTVRQEADPTPSESDDYEPNGGVTGCWPCNGTGCDRCMPQSDEDA